MIFLITVFTICGLAVPVVCVPAHAHNGSTAVSNQFGCDMMVKKADSSKDHNKTKSMAHDNCCLGHHCCSAKLVMPMELGITSIEVTAVLLPAHINQAISSLNINGLDRPPKNLA